jgi:hypothetical protein
MSDIFKDLTKRNMAGAGSPEITREAAVAAALVLINSKVGNSPERGAILHEEMGRLSAYADQIQEALKVK